jgi:hydroxymethylbilane synthase
MSVLRLGTRKSLLAWAQSNWVAREIEKHNPGTQVELVGIETRGDKILDISLQSLAEISGGKEFFVAEIDDALRSRAVDLTVHSMKDLSLDRPEDFVLAANPLRENPRDVALFSERVIEKIGRGEKICIGTSSPRRLENIPPFLKRALPFGNADLQFVEIRGNVNTRLSRVHEAEGSPKQLDAVILAFAGLIRLWKDEKAREELKRLLTGVRWMVLPLRECPAAPAQGALAIECRKDDAEVIAKISKIHSQTTASHVALERELLAEWGGGCHQKFGATAISTGNLAKLFFVRGVKPDGEFIESFSWQAPPTPDGETHEWNGLTWRAEQEGSSTSIPANIDASGKAVFFAHSRALNDLQSESFSQARVWTSGTGSWLRLASKGIWVEGCAEGLGFESLKATLEEHVLQLPSLAQWKVLTHEDALNDWRSVLPEENVLATYRVGVIYSNEAKKQLKQATDFFWSSGSQFNALKAELSDEQLRSGRHACGPGKTAHEIATALANHGLGNHPSNQKRPLVFPSVEEWKKWIIKQV